MSNTDNKNNYSYVEIPEKDISFSGKFEILTADSKEKILKLLKKFQKTHKIYNISFTTNTKYSKMFDREYTEYNIFIQYL